MSIGLNVWANTFSNAQIKQTWVHIFSKAQTKHTSSIKKFKYVGPVIDLSVGVLTQTIVNTSCYWRFLKIWALLCEVEQGNGYG